MANYSDVFSSNNTDAPNTPKVLASKTITGGTVADKQSLKLALYVANYGNGACDSDYTVKLNGVTVATANMGGSATKQRIDVEIVRSSSNGADVFSPDGIDHLTGFAWGSGQALEFVGQSNQEGGATLQWAGLAK